MRIVLALLLAAPLTLFAEAQSHDGHDHDHGADLGNIGKAHLETSCAAEAQKDIDRGVALIHSFWYAEAEKAFRRAAAADAKCGMAWWGVAMSNLHPIWAPPIPAELNAGREAAEKAKTIGAKTDREKAFIAAIATFYADAANLDHRTRMLAYEKAMAGVARDHPKDREASIFHALSLLGIAPPTDKTYANQKQAAEILNRVLPEETEHPGIAHYLIHSFDAPELAPMALPAARVYAKLAPGSPHALHMPSHIFTRLGLWDESISSNLASAKKAHDYVTRSMPDATAFDELHAIDYLVYAYLQQGNLEEARKLAEKTAAVTKIDNPTSFAALYAIGAVPARFALERRQWKEAAALTVPSSVAWDKVPYAEGNLHFARGIGAARSEQPAIARDAATRLAAIRQVLVDQKNAYWADQVEIQRLSVLAWLAHTEKNQDEALKQMRAAVTLEAASEKHPVTPGAVIPARELLADMLLENGKREEATAELRLVLRNAPGRRNAMQQLIRAGALEDALALYQQEITASPDSVTANNNAGVMLDLLGRTRQAKTYFQKAIDAAPTPQARTAAQRAMAMSYAFDNDCANTAKYEEMAFEYWGTVPDSFRQGEALNEAARVCIEAGALDAAEKLYLRGQEAGLKEPNITAARVALWNFRTEHALARLAARRNQPEEAKKRVAAARAILDGNPEMAKDQEIFFPYLTGYVALHLGDASTALTELKKANQNDAFIQVLMAQAHEKLGEKDEAMALYRKAAATTGHNPPAAFARPLATRKLGLR